MKNKLIVFEGIDGSGKTSISKRLVIKLKKENILVVRYEDIEDPKLGFNILKPFISRNCSVHSSFLFYLASAVHKSNIIKALLKDKWVICDRYVYSTIAHHVMKGLDKKIANSLLRKFPVLSPDFLLLITVNEKVRLKRLVQRKNNKKSDLVEKKPGTPLYIKEEVIKSYSPITVNNSDDSIEKVVDGIFKIIIEKNI